MGVANKVLGWFMLIVGILALISVCGHFKIQAQSREDVLIAVIAFLTMTSGMSRILPKGE